MKIKLTCVIEGITLAFLSFFNLQLFAQTNTFPADGNVGIGTITPS